MTPFPARAALLATLLLPTAASAQDTHRHHRHQAAGTGTDAATVTGEKLPPVRVAPDGVPADRIVAIVDGDAITEQDVDDRAKLFALSTGMGVDAATLDRLRGQITRQLIDEKLRVQEIKRRKIVVTPEEISAAITQIEGRNGMQKDALRNKLAADGVSLGTLIDQIRVQIGWTHVLRQNLGPRAMVSEAEIHAREDALRAEQGQTEYNVAEIFIPIDDPTRAAEADRFAQTVITQLRAGAPFGIVAAQFGQNQNALEGGELGWVSADRLDPEVVDVVRQMPQGAVSNPIRVAGGYDIVTLHGKRTIGTQMATVLSVRQAFLPFKTALDPSHPTPDQIATLARARALGGGAHDCASVEAANKAAGSVRPADPGPLVLADLNPQMQNVLAHMNAGDVTHPLVSQDGIAVIAVCSREEKNVATQTPDQIRDQLLAERVELASRQENRDLHRHAVIEMRQS
jgi:peptidyl-prolyl cis-trans isomerase SurA